MMKKYFWFSLIILLFLVTRLYKINSIPGSVYWDEASIGYNAYAITSDLKDEWGEFLPLHFRAFGEFKLPVYVYSVALLTKLFGASEFAVRFPAVIYSLGTVILVYFLVTKIAKKEETGLISSFILAVSPWTFIFSRTGYEATAGLFFFLGFVYLLLFNNGKKINILFSSIFAILSFYSYNSFRILIPIFFAVWFTKTYLFEKKRVKNLILSATAFGIFLVSLFPLVKLYSLDQGAVRLETVGIKEPVTFVKNYFSHFSYDFLFKDGDANDRSQVPDWGQIYFVGLPFFILGVYTLLISRNEAPQPNGRDIFSQRFVGSGISPKRKHFATPTGLRSGYFAKGDKNAWVIVAFLLIGAIPAALTRESPHALRSILLAPTFSVVSAFGICRLLERFEVIKYQKFFVGSVIVVYLLFFGTYFMDFIANYNAKTSESWQYPYKSLFMDIKNSGDEGKRIVSDEYAQPYIFALYYLRYSPVEFRKTVKYNSPDKWGFSTVASFGKFQFIPHDSKL